MFINKYFYYTLLLFAAVLFFSCEKDISVDIPKVEKKVVVEASIETGDYAKVLVTNSMDFFAHIDSNAISKTLITDAIVVLSDGIQTDTLKLAFDASFFPPLVFKGSKILGKEGGMYQLTVMANGKIITASTTIPQKVQLDSAWFQLQPPSDSLGYAWAHLTDPVGLGNNYRWLAMRLNKDQRFLPPPSSLFNDKFIEGTSFDFAYNRGNEFNSLAKDDLNEERGFFKTGDTIIVKFCSLDDNSYKFLYALETGQFSNGNPFASPVTIPNNMSEGGFGNFTGYAVTYDTIYAK